MSITKRGYNSYEASEYLGIAESTLRRGRMDGPRGKWIVPPPFLKVGRKVIYLKEDLDKWLESQKVKARGAL